MSDITQEDLDLVRALQMGSEEEAAVALKKLRGQILPDQSKAILDERLRFHDAAHRFSENFPDVNDDPEAKAVAYEVDSELAKKHPELDYDTRFTIAGNVTREQLGDAETRDYAEAIAAMKVARSTPAKAKDQSQSREARLAELKENRQSRDENPVEREIERARAEEIAEMKEARKGRIVEYAPPERWSDKA